MKNPTIFHFLFNQHPAGMPPAMWKSVRRESGSTRIFASVGVAFFVVGVSIQLIAGMRLFLDIHLLPAGADQFLIWQGLILVSIIFVAIANHRLKKSVRAYVRQHQGLICLNCGYVLRGLPRSGRCPECTTEYTFDGNREAWEACLPDIWES